MSEMKATHNVVLVGKPTDVENQVNSYLKDGYQINSDLMPWTLPGTNDTVFVQQLVLYEEV